MNKQLHNQIKQSSPQSDSALQRASPSLVDGKEPGVGLGSTNFGSDLNPNLEVRFPLTPDLDLAGSTVKSLQNLLLVRTKPPCTNPCNLEKTPVQDHHAKFCKIPF